MLQEAITQLREAVRAESVKVDERVARIMFSDSSRVVFEFEDKKMTTVKAYGRDLSCFTQELERYKTSEEVYEHIQSKTFEEVLRRYVTGYSICNV